MREIRGLDQSAEVIAATINSIHNLLYFTHTDGVTFEPQCALFL